MADHTIVPFPSSPDGAPPRIQDRNHAPALLTGPEVAHAVGTSATIVLSAVQLLQRRAQRGTLHAGQLAEGLAAIEAAARRLAVVAERLERGDTLP